MIVFYDSTWSSWLMVFVRSLLPCLPDEFLPVVGKHSGRRVCRPSAVPHPTEPHLTPPLGTSLAPQQPHLTPRPNLTGAPHEKCVFVATALSSAFAPMCFHIRLCVCEPGCELKKRPNRVHKRLAPHTSPRCAAMLLSSLFIATPMCYKQQPSNKLLTTNALNKHLAHRVSHALQPKSFAHGHPYYPMRYEQQPSNKQLTTNALNKHFPPGTPRFTRASTNVTHVCLQRPRAGLLLCALRVTSTCLSQVAS